MIRFVEQDDNEVPRDEIVGELQLLRFTPLNGNIAILPCQKSLKYCYCSAINVNENEGSDDDMRVCRKISLHTRCMKPIILLMY